MPRPPRALTNGLLAAATLLLATAGALALVHSDPTPIGPPQPPARADLALPVHPRFAQPLLNHSIPLHIDIPVANVHADITPVGWTSRHQIDAPPLNHALLAGWLQDGPSPGQTGTAIIDGHVDSAEIPGNEAAFYHLGDTRPGDQIDVILADHTVAVFTADSVQTVPKDQFPSALVYHPAAYPALTLITCGGPFDAEAHSYLDNILVYTHLTSTIIPRSAPPV